MKNRHKHIFDEELHMKKYRFPSGLDRTWTVLSVNMHGPLATQKLGLPRAWRRPV